MYLIKLAAVQEYQTEWNTTVSGVRSTSVYVYKQTDVVTENGFTSRTTNVYGNVNNGRVTSHSTTRSSYRTTSLRTTYSTYYNGDYPAGYYGCDGYHYHVGGFGQGSLSTCRNTSRLTYAGIRTYSTNYQTTWTSQELVTSYTTTSTAYKASYYNTLDRVSSRNTSYSYNRNTWRTTTW